MNLLGPLGCEGIHMNYVLIVLFPIDVILAMLLDQKVTSISGLYSEAIFIADFCCWELLAK